MRRDSVVDLPLEIHDINHFSLPAPIAHSTVGLPLEIHDLILDYLSLPAPTAWYDRDSPQSAENRATLRAYSMVSRTFCVAAYSRLFSSVILRVKAFSRIRNTRLVASAIRRFISILQDSLNFPNIGMIYHLRSFALTIQIDCNSGQAYNFLRDATIHRLIDALHGPNHGVESLALNIDYGKPEEVIPTTHDLLRAFQEILCSPKLVRMRLDGFIGLPGALFHGTNLKFLELYNTQTEQGRNKLDPPLITTMESIGVDGSFSLVDLLHSHNDSINTTSRYQAAFVKLKSFYFLAYMVEEIPNAINIALNAANTLHILHIRLFGNRLGKKFDKPHPSFDPKYPFHLLPRLSSLRLSSKKIGPGSDDLIHPFRCILESCTVPQSLRTLSVETMVSDIFFPHPDKWFAMDSVLLRPVFDSVLKISIVIEYPIYTSVGYNSYVADDDADLQQNIKASLLNVLPSFSKSRRGDSQRRLDVDVVIKRFNGKSSRYQNTNQSAPKELILKCGGRKELGIL